LGGWDFFSTGCFLATTEGWGADCESDRRTERKTSKSPKKAFFLLNSLPLLILCFWNQKNQKNAGKIKKIRPEQA